MRFAAERRDIAQAVQRFQADRRWAASEPLTHWLRTDAITDRTYVTYLHVDETTDPVEIAAFAAIRSGSVIVTTRRFRRTHHLEGEEVPATHIAYLARAEGDRFRGAGKRALQHAIDTAKAVAAVQGNYVVTLDPYDDDTADMWRRQAPFQESDSEIDGEPALRRLWLVV
jgi:hypothetical protein